MRKLREAEKKNKKIATANFSYLFIVKKKNENFSFFVHHVAVFKQTYTSNFHTFHYRKAFSSISSRLVPKFFLIQQLLGVP
jgi:hypothetical protein